MSHRIVNDALYVSGLAPATKLVLLALAEHANEKTGVCWPSNATLAAICEISERHVRRHLHLLQKADLVARSAHSGRGHARGRRNPIRLNLSRIAEIANSRRAELKPKDRRTSASAYEVGKEDIFGMDRRTPMSSGTRTCKGNLSVEAEPVTRLNAAPEVGVGVETSDTPPKAPHDENREGGFNSFWLAYPRKEGRGAAERVWASLNPDAETQAAIHDAIRWQRTTDQWKREDGRYVPQPAKWLTDQHWQDVQPPARDWREELRAAGWGDPV